MAPGPACTPRRSRKYWVAAFKASTQNDMPYGTGSIHFHLCSRCLRTLGSIRLYVEGTKDVRVCVSACLHHTTRVVNTEMVGPSASRTSQLPAEAVRATGLPTLPPKSHDIASDFLPMSYTCGNNWRHKKLNMHRRGLGRSYLQSRRGGASSDNTDDVTTHSGQRSRHSLPFPS